jgi:hypothetical protein
MVRLVFRPYTHVRRTICTSVSLRASIRVSPDFTLRRHSSPSFGSYRTRSYSIHPTGSADAALMASLTFIPRDGFSTFTLACTLDSLVRVSRRVGKGHFDRIARSSSSRAPTGYARFRRSNCLTHLCGPAAPSGLRLQDTPSPKLRISPSAYYIPLPLPSQRFQVF